MRPRLPLRSLRRALPLLVAAGFASPATAAAALPDLVSDPAESVSLQDYAPDFGDGNVKKRRLLRFDGHIHNAGAGAFEIQASGSGGQMDSVRQLVEGGARTIPAKVRYEGADGHNHWHLMSVARYSLGLPGGPEVAPALKVGFCLIDSERRETTGPADEVYRVGDFCHQGQTAATDLKMGVSSGWRDVYERYLSFQWVDVSEVQPGNYEARAQIDPDGYVVESDESNPPSAVPAVVPGYRAKARSLTGVPTDRPTTVALDADVFQAVEIDRGPDGETTPFPIGARRVRLDSAPAKGALNVPLNGQWIDAATVQYTPAPGATGSDSFRFSAREAGSEFPSSPLSATVSIGLAAADPAPAISGPHQVIAATSVKLDGPAGAVWSVDSVTGQDVGSVTSAGLYSAPATVPAGEEVTVRISSGGRTATKRLRILAPPAQPAAPSPPDPEFFTPATPAPVTPFSPVATPLATPEPTPVKPPPARAPAAIDSFGVTRIGSLVSAAVRTGRSGRLRVSLLAGRRKLTGCVVKARAGAPVACRLRVPRRAGHHLRVVATLKSSRGTSSRSRDLPSARHH